MLELVVEGLVSTLEAKGVLNLEALKAVITSIDLADGTLDKKMSTPSRLD